MWPSRSRRAASSPVITCTRGAIANPVDIPLALKFAGKIPGLRGVLVITGDKMGMWGEIKITGL